MEEDALVFEVRAGGVAEGVAAAAIGAAEELFDDFGVVFGEAALATDALVHHFGEGFGGFDGEAVKV